MTTMDNNMSCEDDECPVKDSCDLYINNQLDYKIREDVTGYRLTGGHSCPLYHTTKYKETR